MEHVVTRMSRICFLVLFLSSAILGAGQVSVLTQHNDNSRTGQNLNETTLTTSNVNQAGFGKLFWRTVDGYIYAQPLYVPAVNVQGSLHNVVYVATEHNSVYAFDADDPNAKAPFWHVNFGPPVASQDICILTGDTDPGDCPYLDLNPEIGVTSTPVIDPTAGILYLVSRTKSITNGTYHFQLHALDLSTGIEKLGGPVEIAGQVGGTGAGSQGGVVPFDPAFNIQRPGLLLLNGVVYIAFGSVGDIGTYHGWVMGYNAATLQQVAILNVSPDGCCGGIWGAGQGLVGDSSNNVYLITADGDFNADTGGRNYGDSFLKLNGTSLNVTDYFTPFNQATLFSANTDLGSGGPLLLPGTSLLVGMGKDKTLRLVDTTNMGHFNATSNHDVQEFTATSGTFFGAPVYWNSPNNGPSIYLWGPNDFLKAYKFTGTQFQTTPISSSTVQNSSGFSNAAALSLSSSGSTSGSGILWTSASFSGLATGISRPGIVRAFDATDLTRELWNSRQNLNRDDVGGYAKFVPPTVVNGKMYMGSFSGQLLVYGLNPPAASGIRFIQAASTSPGTTQSTLNTAYSSSQTPGNFNVVIVGWNDTISTVQSVTDSVGNTYSLAIGPTTGTGVRQSIYYAKNIAGGTNTVTVVFNQGAASPDVRILEYAGVSSSNPLDVSQGGSGNGNIAESGFVNTTSPDEVIIGANTALAGSIVAGAPSDTRLMTSPNVNVASDRIVNVKGSYDAWVPLKANANWVMQVVTFRAVGSPTAPTVSSVTPNNGPIAGGTSITIAGTNFANGATVTLGGAAATGVVRVSGTQISAVTPAHAAGVVDVVVTNPDTQSDTLAGGYSYVSLTAPAISSVTPNSGPFAGGTAVSIAGTKFVSGATVRFGGVAASNVVVVSATQITATTPGHAAGVVDVIVTNPDAQSGTLTNGFTFRAAPTVGSVTPNNGALAGGTAVTIAGANFAAGASVTFGGAAATNIVVVSTAQITATTPAHAAGAVNVVVTNTDTQSGSLTNGFTYVTAVPISFSQVAAATPQVATQVINLAFPGAQTVGDLNVVIVGWNDVTSRVQSVTDSAGNVYSLAIGPTIGSGQSQSIYYAANIAGGSNTVTVQFNQAAVYPDIRILEYRGISSVDVTAGASGSGTSTSSGPATTTSANELILAANTVATGNTAAGPGFTARIITTPDLDIVEDQIVTSAGAYTATAPISPAGGWVMQMVTFRAGAGTAPTISSIAPNSGSSLGNTSVTIAGTNFASGAGVTFGGTAATNVVVVSATQITATTPAHAAGAVNVVVTNTDTQTGTLANGFTYASTAPTVSSVTPNNGPATGGTSVTVAGTNFVSGASVFFGGTAATNVVVVNGTQITATVPAHAVGAVNVLVTNTDTQSGTLANGYTYASTAPAVTSVTPNNGPVAGGTAVTIAGANFVSGATVVFGGTAATNVVVVSGTQITATAPAHAAGAVNLVVTNTDAQSGTLANGYTYVSASAPTVTSVAPNNGPVAGGTAVTIAGTNFVNGATVAFGGTAGTNVVFVSATQITATSPAHAAGAVNLVVTNPDAQSGTLTGGFTYRAAPTVSSVTPNNGPLAGGTAVTIAGANFVSGATVTFDGTAASNVVVVNAAQITAATPAHAAGAVNVQVVNPDSQNGTLTNGFTYTAAVAISFGQVAAATPQVPTQVVTVSYPGAQTVGDLNVVVVGWNDVTSIVQSVTDSAGNVYSLAIGPTTGTGERQSIYYAANIAGGNNTVTVQFNQPALYPDVRILEYRGVSSVDVTAGASGSGTSTSSGPITTTSANELLFAANTVSTGNTGAGAGFTARVITTPDLDLVEDQVVSSAGTYTATAPISPTGTWVMQMVAFRAGVSTAPTVSSVAPNNGSLTGGTAVTITGTKFVAGAGVSFGGTAATNIVVVSGTQITATTPAHIAGAVNVVVTNPDTQSGTLANGFTYISTAPTVTSVTPNNGPVAGGTAVTIAGTNFVNGASVSFGGTAATNVVVVGGTQITATVPAHTAGAVNVVITNPDAQSGTLAIGYTYVSASAPTVSSVTPNNGPVAGGTAVTIAGTNFVTGANVSFGGTAATNVVVISAIQLTATVPAHAAGAVNVVVTNPDAQTGTLTSGYTYRAAPTVSSVTPNNGPLAGGTAVTLAGANFVNGAIVTFGGTAATNVTVVSAAQITATTPAHAAGAVNVVVTNPDSQSGTLTNAFTYTTAVAISFGQVAAATPQTATQVINLAFPGAQTIGNLNVVVVGWNDATSTVQSVTDSAGNVYNLAVGPVTGTGLRQSIYYAANIVGGSNTVTVQFNQAVAYPDIRILEYRGVRSIDVTASASGSGTTTSVGPITTTSANELVFAANTVSTGATAAGTGFTSRIITSPDLDIAEDMVAATAGSYTATCPIAPSGNWVMQVVAFK